MLWYANIGAAEVCVMPDDQPLIPIPENWVLMNDPRPENRPDRFGGWSAGADGVWIWTKYPDPPFPVVYHEGKIKNGDTLVEIPAEILPGDIAARLAALEALLLPPTP